MLTALSHALALLSGVKRASLTIVLGAIAAFAMPPYGLFPLFFISFTGLYWLLQGAVSDPKPLRTAMLLGWYFGFGYHVSGLWWIGAATLVEAEKFIYFLPLAVFALPAGLAIFTALSAMLYLKLAKTRLGGALSFALAFFLGEVARGHILTGFPWNLYGYGLTQFAPLAQSASLIGVYGLTFLALLLFVAPAFGKRSLFLSLACLITMGGFGAWRLHQNPTRFHEKIALRLMQPNIPQLESMQPSNKEALLKTYLELSDKARSQAHNGLSEVTHLIWPESPFPAFILEDAKMMAQISKVLPATTTLLTGALRREAPLPGQIYPRVYNSLIALNSKGEVVQSYDKVHLVPFGEYLPFQALLESWGLEQFTRLIGGFTAGQKRVVMALPNTPAFTPLICYEIVFPNAVMPQGKALSRPQWLVNITNDAWFGVTPGPYQHLHMAQVRAIEEGLPVVRVANNGVSAVVDNVGRITAQLNLNQKDVLDGRLPTPLSQPLYALYGNINIILLFLLSLFFKLTLGKTLHIKLKKQA